MAHADWIIDFWPGAGHDGGRIVFDGTPADLVAARSTLTGEHLAAFVGSRPKAVPSRWARRHASPSEPACPHPLAPERVGQERDGSKHLIRPAPTPAAERPPGITCEKYTTEAPRCRQAGTRANAARSTPADSSSCRRSSLLMSGSTTWIAP
jgi:hypothetical protein